MFWLLTFLNTENVVMLRLNTLLWFMQSHILCEFVGDDDDNNDGIDDDEEEEDNEIENKN